MGTVLEQSHLVILQRTLPQNLEYVMKSESAPENSPFVGQWNLEEHEAALRDPDLLHLLAFDKQNDVANWICYFDRTEKSKP